MIPFNKSSVFISYILSILLVISASVNAATIRGKVIDKSTDENLAGVVVLINNQSNNMAVTDIDGNYLFRNLQPGKYILSTKSLSYENLTSNQIVINELKDSFVFNIYLKPKTTSINEVRVVGNMNKETDVSARHSEQVASNVITILSAKSIESLPDLNVANIMQRTSGVSMMKNSSGNNSQVVIRGMPPRYNSALVDGIVIPSTSGSSRSVPLDIFPSVLVGRIEVTKALTPDMEGSGLGGVANIIMKDAPDSSILSLDLSTGYNQYFTDHKLSTFNYGVVNNNNPAQIHGTDYITKNTDFPIENLVLKSIQAPPDLHVSISYGNRYLKKKLGFLISGTYQTTYQGSINNYLGTQLNPNTNNLDTISWNRTIYSNQVNRKGLVIKLDYWLNGNNQISLYNTYLNMDEIRGRHDIDTTSEINRGKVILNDITNLDLSSIESITLHGKHLLSKNTDIEWFATYSVANSQSPDLVNVSYDKVIHPIEPAYLHYSSGVTRTWQWNNDEDKSAFVNINYKPIIYGHLFEFKFGGMGRMKLRMNNENEYDFNAPAYNSNYPNPDIRQIFDTLPRLNIQQMQGDAIDNPANYIAHENIEAGYAMLKTSIKKLQLLTGVRIEFTNQFNTHNQIDKGFGGIGSNDFNYYDLLPSLHLNYQLTEKQNVRFSAYKAVSRPNYTEVVPYVQKGANGNSSGNDSLKHTSGICFDSRYEFYPNGDEVLSAGLFYKHLTNAIEEITNVNNDRSFTNIPDCENFGFELVGIKYFGNFGINANYTFTKSSIRVGKNWNDTTHNRTITRVENRPLVGQSPHLINLALIFRNFRNGFKTQLTYTMQGRNVVNPSSYYGLDSYQLNYHDLGFSVEKSLRKHFIVYIKSNNLLNSGIQYQTKNGINTRQLTSQRSFLIGLKLNL